jgi:hypothetical protein
MRRARDSQRLALAALCAVGASACTSEADLGYWTATPLSSAGTTGGSPPIPPMHGEGAHDAAISDEPQPQPPKAMPTDSGLAQPQNPLCLRNPSLDGIPNAGPIAPGTWWPAEAWDLCFNDPEDFPDASSVAAQLCAVTIVNDATTIDPQDGTGARAGALLPPTHGVGYLHFDNLRELPERTSQTMCGDLRAGVTYNFAIDLASRAGQAHEGIVLGQGALEIYGSNISCGHTGEPLWRSPPLTKEWRTYCVSITPRTRASVLTLQMPSKDQPRSAILVDNIRLLDGCGPAVVD